ncbi:MAG: hypothetical protein JNK15_05030 [Planctomycetes bacterium]|nr:hypothetical protein [Planctomycetota bacterium]
MHMLRPLLTALFVGIATGLAAQSYVVDVNGGPGANFTSLGAAVAAVPDGAILRVRPGDYPESVVVAAKGLTIAADVGAQIVAPAGLPALHVVGLGPVQTFVVRGLALRSATGTGELRLEYCQGLAFVDNTGGFLQARLYASHCDALLVSWCSWYDPALPAAILDSCRAVFDSCSVGELRQFGGELQIAGGAVTGRASTLGQGGAAVTMQGGDLRLLGCQLAGGFSLVAPGRAIEGTGSVRRTPDAVLQGASPPVSPTVAMVTAAMLRVATSWITGPIYSVYASGAVGDLAFLVGAERSLPQVVPGLDAVWLDAATARIETAGVLTGGAFAAMFQLPSSPALTGLSVVWQVVAFAPTGAMSVSNPTWLVMP